MIELIAKPLTAKAFLAFGDVVDIENASKTFSMNYEMATRYYDLADIDVNDNGGKTCVSLVKSKAVKLPFEAKLMEYHPFGSQLFHPLGNIPFLILVAPPAEKLVSDKLELFISNGMQGVNYRKGVWHHYLIPLQEDSDFIVVDHKADDNNCVETELDTKVVFKL